MKISLTFGSSYVVSVVLVEKNIFDAKISFQIYLVYMLAQH